jgi:tRNA dimethylallyltransferase
VSDAELMGNLFLLDGSDLQQWDAKVVAPAVSLTGGFLNGETLPDPKCLSAEAQKLLNPQQEYDISQRRDLWVRRTCEMCHVTAVTEALWNKHVNSHRHQKAVSTKLKKQQKAARKEQARISETRWLNYQELTLINFRQNSSTR